MPYPNYHSARIQNPDDFEKVVVLKTIDNGIMIYGGPLKTDKDGPTKNQAYRFPKDKFTVTEAKQWLKDNNIEYILFEPATEDMGSAILKIYDEIGYSGITPAFVSDFIDQHKDSTEIIVRINSPGGSVDDGWAIHDLLVNSGKKIKTIGEGKIYSIATVVFLAGSEREIMSNADGLIHNPFIPGENLSGNDLRSDDLLLLAEYMAQENKKMLDLYVKETKSPEERLAEYMKEDTKLSAEDMLSLGFATKIIEPVKAYAFIKPKINYNMTENDVKTFGQKIDTILEKIKGLSRLPSKDQTLKDKDGKEFNLEKESGAPAVGDKATPDGTFVMADGKTIVIANGVISEIKEPAAAKTELELANEKIADLQKQLDAEKAKVADAEKSKLDLVAAEADFKAKEAEAKAMITELTALKNSWHPESRHKFSAAEKVGEIDMRKLKELKSQNKGE